MPGTVEAAMRDGAGLSGLAGFHTGRGPALPGPVFAWTYVARHGATERPVTQLTIW